jgi:Alpha-kinase family
VNDLKSPLHFGLVRWGKSASTETKEVKMLMRRAADPCAEGELRLAYYGKIGPDEAALDSSTGDKILKSFKKSRKSESDRKHYLAQMEVSTIAHFLAEEYNKTSRLAHCPEIKFLSIFMVETEDPKAERFCAEDQLPCAATAFTKYSNNTGYWNEDEINQSLLLFTVFTYKKTGGYMMVTDLQGVRHGNQFILTDPAILCKDSTRFGDTNLGGKLINKCLESTKAMLEEYGWDD